MAQFERKVNFTAYQFNLKQVQGLPAHDIEDIIMGALESDNPMPSAYLTTKGTLVVTLYTYGQEAKPKTFELSPGEWLTDKGTDAFSVVTDAAFKEFTAVSR